MSQDSGQGAEIPSVRADLLALIHRGLEHQYVSESCQDAIQTGNHYQSVTLGETTTQGFRSPRLELLDRVDFNGRRVLDLGSNLGEISRAVRSRGADLVDGFEYDAYFLELANLINAYNGSTRVSFYQRDITDASVYTERYDIVVALAVFIYVRPLMNVLDRITGEAFLLETHRIDENLESFYLDAMRPYFPAYISLGETEWGNPHEEPVKRAFMLFARNQQTLDSLLLR